MVRSLLSSSPHSQYSSLKPSSSAALMAALMALACSEWVAVLGGLVIVYAPRRDALVDQAVVCLEAEVAVEASLGLVVLAADPFVHHLILGADLGRVDVPQV